MAIARWTLLFTIVCISGIVAPPLHAQYPTPESMGLNYTLTVGAAFLAKTNTNNRSFATVGLSWYDTISDNMGASAALGFSGDWLQIERSDGETVQIVPLMLNYKQYAIIGGWRTFVNLGVGVIALTDTIPEMQYTSTTNFGWNGGLGVDITNNLFFQTRFIGGKNPADDGFTAVQLGYRF